MIIFKKENVGLVLTYYAKDLRDRLDPDWIQHDFTNGEVQHITRSGDRIIRTIESGRPTPEEVKSIIGMLPPRLFCFVINPLEHALRTGGSQREITDQVDAWYRWEDGPDVAFEAENLIFSLGHHPNRFRQEDFTSTEIAKAFEAAQEDFEYFGYDPDETVRKYSVQL